MSEDATKNLTTDDKLNLLLTEMASVKTELTSVRTELTSVKVEFGSRLSRLEAIAEDRARDTRPMLNQLHQEIAETRAEIRDLRAEVLAEVQGLRAEVLADRQEWRAEIKEIKDRLTRIETKMDLFNAKAFEMRTDHRILDRRLTAVERQAA